MLEISIYEKNESLTRYYLKHSNLGEYDKITEKSSDNYQYKKRYVFSDNINQNTIGVRAFRVSESLGSSNIKLVYVPSSSNIFKAPGGGQNYIHGGASPQEIILPMIDIKTKKGRAEGENVGLMLITLISKLSINSVNLEFIQQTPIGDDIHPTTFKISFVDDRDNVISNEELFLANSTSEDPRDRIFKLHFHLKNQEYRREDKYYILVIDQNTNEEIIKNEILIDIPML